MIYLLNSPILTSYGLWQFKGPLSMAQARGLVQEGFSSAVGHESAAKLLAHLLGVTVPVNRVPITMQAGDGALVLRILARLPEGAVLDAQTLEATPYELSFLKKTADAP